MARVYNFSVIRVSPDPRRGELVNIGIIVFLPGRVDVRVLTSLAKVQALHGEIDLARLHNLPESLAAFASTKRSVADRHSLIHSVGMVELSPLGQFAAVGNDEYEETVNSLMNQLVKPSAGTRFVDEEKQSKLLVQVKKAIKGANLLGKSGDIDNHKVVPRFPIDPEKGLYADIAGKNSVYHFGEAVDYRVGRGIHGSKFNESAKAAFVLRECQKRHSDSKRILLYAASPAVEIQVQQHLNLLSEFATDFFNFESAQDRSRFIVELARAFGGELPIN